MVGNKNDVLVVVDAMPIGNETTEDVLKFLQLEEYRDKIERDTKIVAGDKLAFTEYKNYSTVGSSTLSNSNSPYLVPRIEINLHCLHVHVVEIRYHPVGLLSLSTSGMIP